MACFHGGVRAKMWVAGAGAVAVLAGTAPPAARADACPAAARASYARVQLFKDSACSGASVSAGFTGSGDRPDFAAFTNYEGAVYDIDDTRDSVAIAPATCIRLFDGKRFTGVDSGLLCAPQTTDGLFSLPRCNDEPRVVDARLPGLGAQRLQRGGGASATTAPAEREPGHPRCAAGGDPGGRPQEPHRRLRPCGCRPRRADRRRRGADRRRCAAGLHA